MPRPRRQVQVDSPTPDAGVYERILDTARKLFYKEGIQAVGIQRLIDEAGIAKASLYAHFASKDDLVAAYLDRRAAEWNAQVDERLSGSRLTPRGKLLRLFDFVVELVEGPDFCGCPLLKANSEMTDPAHPAKAVTEKHRKWLHQLVGGLVRETGVASPDRVAGALLVLLDGAMATALLDNDASAARQARWAAEQILDR